LIEINTVHIHSSKELHGIAGVKLMTQYRVSFFKYLLSSDGHPAKALQQTIEVRHARSAERAIQAARLCFERRSAVPEWTLHADAMEVQVVNTNTQEAA
jgi:hypothetical protein